MCKVQKQNVGDRGDDSVPVGLVQRTAACHLVAAHFQASPLLTALRLQGHLG